MVILLLLWLYYYYYGYNYSYTKPKGQLPDYSTPVVLRVDQSSVEELCNSLHKSIMKEFKQSVNNY